MATHGRPYNYQERNSRLFKSQVQNSHTGKMQMLLNYIAYGNAFKTAASFCLHAYCLLTVAEGNRWLSQAAQ